MKYVIEIETIPICRPGGSHVGYFHGRSGGVLVFDHELDAQAAADILDEKQNRRDASAFYRFEVIGRSQ